MTLNIFKRGTKTYIANKMDEVEFVNPREFLKDFHTGTIYPSLLNIFIVKLGVQSKNIKKIVLKEAMEIAESQMSYSEKLVLPSQIVYLLDNNLSKKEQYHLLDNISVSKEQLAAIYIQAGAKGYLFSNYVFDGIPKSYRECDLPSFIRIKDDGNVESYGKHILSEGQLKDIVLQSKFIIARFLDRDKHWHCFYQTKKGVYGKEHGEKGRKPHIHYISDAFGISREDFIKGLKGGQVPSSKIHIFLQ